MVHLNVANHHGKLAGIKRERLDGAAGRRSGASVPIGVSANECIGRIFWECGAPDKWVAVGDAAANIALVPEAALKLPKILRPPRCESANYLFRVSAPSKE